MGFGLILLAFEIQTNRDTIRWAESYLLAGVASIFSMTMARRD